MPPNRATPNGIMVVNYFQTTIIYMHASICMHVYVCVHGCVYVCMFCVLFMYHVYVKPSNIHEEEKPRRA